MRTTRLPRRSGSVPATDRFGLMPSARPDWDPRYEWDGPADGRTPPDHRPPRGRPTRAWWRRVVTRVLTSLALLLMTALVLVLILVVLLIAAGAPR